MGNHDQDELAVPLNEAKADSDIAAAPDDQSRLSTEGFDVEVERDAVQTKQKKGRSNSKRKRGATDAADSMAEGSDFEPAKPLKKPKRKAKQAVKGRKKAKGGKETVVEDIDGRQSSLSEGLQCQKSEGPVSGQMERDGGDESGPTLSPALQELDVNTTVGANHDKETVPPELAVDGVEPTPSKAVPTAVASTKVRDSASQSGKAKDPKQVYRVGLSKAARIPSLLRITRK
jgi:hypothetical protein